MNLPAQFQQRLSPEAFEQFELLEREAKIEFLAKECALSEPVVLAEIAQASGLQIIEDIQIPIKDLPNIPVRILNEYKCLPIAVDPLKKSIRMATVWPPEPLMDQWLFALTGHSTEWTLAPADKIIDAMTRAFGVGSDSLEDSDIEDLSAENDEEEDEEAAIISFVNEVIRQALSKRATDIHFEPQKEDLNIRYRIDGHLVPVQVPKNLVRFQAAIIARIKVMARLNISERRRPQDGRISFNSRNEQVDIRISTLPTMFGESVSLRLLSQETQGITLDRLGMPPETLAEVAPVLERPHGIILVTGPTGSGKSTTLNAFMRQISKPSRRIVTIEDPVEYEVPGINQTQINSEIGLTFAQALRHVLRQDPDVIMVGEIRDSETATIAVRASLTGHLVLSTLHTNDSAGALARLIDMGIEPFLIASSIELVIAQRLVRRLCPKCAKPHAPEPAILKACLEALEISPSAASSVDQLKMEVGCESCQQTGYQGRLGLFEALRIRGVVKDMIVERKSSHAIREAAKTQGLKTLQRCGWQHCINGNTSLAEVMRFAEEVRQDAPQDSAKA